MRYPKAFESLIKQFASLPSIGKKMAERLVLHVFRQDKETILSLIENLRKLTELSQCSRCFHICDGDICDICRDKKRDGSIICVVEDPIDVISIERAEIYNGLYHVLGGLLEVVPSKDDDSVFTIRELLARLRHEKIREVIIATNPTTEGDMTALYLKRKIQPFKVKVTRLGRGLSTGGDIEHADEETLGASLANRREIS